VRPDRKLQIFSKLVETIRLLELDPRGGWGRGGRRENCGDFCGDPRQTPVSLGIVLRRGGWLLLPFSPKLSSDAERYPKILTNRAIPLLTCKGSQVQSCSVHLSVSRIQDVSENPPKKAPGQFWIAADLKYASFSAIQQIRPIRYSGKSNPFVCRALQFS
jgi:hypothetical protein